MFSSKYKYALIIRQTPLKIKGEKKSVKIADDTGRKTARGAYNGEKKEGTF